MSIYDEQIMNEQDQKKLKSAQDAYLKAEASGDKEGMNAAHAYAESIRKSYGYSGGESGSGYVQLPGYEGSATMNNAGANLGSSYDNVGEAYKQRSEAQKESIDKETDSILKQAYISNMMGNKNVDQRLKASGVSGGLSETTRAGIRQNYENNRISTQQAAVDAKKDIDINTNTMLAENEKEKANAMYSADVNKAQFEQGSAENNRNAQMNQEYLDMSKEEHKANMQSQTDSKYLTFISNGLVDSNNSKEVAAALGLPESVVLQASQSAKNGDYANVALTLLSQGIYDDSFVELLGGRFSKETLQEYAKQNKPNFKSSSNSGGNNSGYKNSYYVKQEYDYKETPQSVYKPSGLPLDKVGYTEEEWTDYVRTHNYFEGVSYREIQSLAKEMGVDPISIMAQANVLKYADKANSK